MLKNGLGGWSLVLVIGEELGDEVLGLVGDVGPYSVLEVEGSLSNLLHDVLVALSIEGWHTGEKDVGDDSARPDVALAVIVLVENLWGNVVWGSEFLVKVSAWVVHQGGTEINDLDLVELLVGFKQNVLWLEISVIKIDRVKI